jgi:hypothetical protein
MWIHCVFQNLDALRSGHAARPWLTWLVPVALFLLLRAVRFAAEAHCMCAVWLPAPSPVGLLTLLLLNALATVPLFRWPGRLPVPVLAAATLQAVVYLQYLSVVNVAVLGRVVGIWVGVPNVAVLLWIVAEAAVALPNAATWPNYRLCLYRHYAYTLPIGTLLQVALVGGTTLLRANPWTTTMGDNDATTM